MFSLSSIEEEIYELDLQSSLKSEKKSIEDLVKDLDDKELLDVLFQPVKKIPEVLFSCENVVRQHDFANFWHF